MYHQFPKNLFQHFIIHEYSSITSPSTRYIYIIEVVFYTFSYSYVVLSLKSEFIHFPVGQLI